MGELYASAIVAAVAVLPLPLLLLLLVVVLLAVVLLLVVVLLLAVVLLLVVVLLLAEVLLLVGFAVVPVGVLPFAGLAVVPVCCNRRRSRAKAPRHILCKSIRGTGSSGVLLRVVALSLLLRVESEKSDAGNPQAHRDRR